MEHLQIAYDLLVILIGFAALSNAVVWAAKTRESDLRWKKESDHDAYLLCCAEKYRSPLLSLDKKLIQLAKSKKIAVVELPE